MSDELDMPDALSRIDAALAASQVAHVFVGALPVLAWGRPRGTTDFDLVVFCSAADLDRLTLAFRERGIERKADFPSASAQDDLPDMVIFWTSKSPQIRVDVFVAKTEFERAVLRTAKDATIYGTPLRVASAESSIIYKLISSRAKDVADIESMFATRMASGEPLDWAFLDLWAQEWDLTEKLATYRGKFGPFAA